MNPQPAITPVEHASFTLKWGDISLALDPVGKPERYGHPSLILITDIHSDHFDPATLAALPAAIIAPQAVMDDMPEAIKPRTTVMKNDETMDIHGFRISAVPMYNIPGAANADFHPKGRGNGYIIEKGGVRVYIAGDTAPIPEMRAFTDLAIAFIPMNLPYTMSVDEAAGATIALKPRIAIPYHYRGVNGLSDVALFKTLVEGANVGVQVELLKWYA